MYRDVLVNKWFLGAFILCVICSIGCLLWYQNEMAKIRKEMKAHEAFITQRGDEKSVSEVVVKQTATGEIGRDEWNENVETAFVNEDAAKASEGVSEKMQNNDTADVSLSKTASTQARVSPFGFGPYPKIPEDYPGYPFNNGSANHELIARVKVKLWKQGIRSSGGIIRNGLVYPIIPGKVYVEWNEFTDSNGTVVKTPARILGDPDDLPPNESLLDEVIRKVEGRPKVIDLPSHLEILSFDEGIDPYEFLDLQ